MVSKRSILAYCAPKRISVGSFCQSNGIPYELFSKWFGKYHKAVMPLHVDGMPQELLQSIGTQDSSQSLLEDYDNIQPDACNHWH